MIRLSGLEEGADISIEFTGIRPGEKLYEEMFFNHEIAEATEHPKVLRARNGHHDICTDAQIQELIDAAVDDTLEEQLRDSLRELVPDFVTNGVHAAAIAAESGAAAARIALPHAPAANGTTQNGAPQNGATQNGPTQNGASGHAEPAAAKRHRGSSGEIRATA